MLIWTISCQRSELHGIGDSCNTAPAYTHLLFGPDAGKKLVVVPETSLSATRRYRKGAGKGLAKKSTERAEDSQPSADDHFPAEIEIGSGDGILPRGIVGVAEISGFKRTGCGSDIKEGDRFSNSSSPRNWATPCFPWIASQQLQINDQTDSKIEEERSQNMCQQGSQRVKKAAGCRLYQVGRLSEKIMMRLHHRGGAY
jgi:hypothetical protein